MTKTNYKPGQSVLAPCRIRDECGFFREALRVGQIMERHTGVANWSDAGGWLVPRRAAPTVDRYGYVWVRFGYGADWSVSVCRVDEVEPVMTGTQGATT